tara:strand:- start:35 stop:238 length:204 start_codon:yes stop_codon:yes gene_type:complete
MADPKAFPDKEKENQNEAVDKKIERILGNIDFKAIDKRIEKKTSRAKRKNRKNTYRARFNRTGSFIK